MMPKRAESLPSRGFEGLVLQQQRLVFGRQVSVLGEDIHEDIRQPVGQVLESRNQAIRIVVHCLASLYGSGVIGIGSERREVVDHLRVAEGEPGADLFRILNERELARRPRTSLNRLSGYHRKIDQGAKEDT